MGRKTLSVTGRLVVAALLLTSACRAPQATPADTDGAGPWGQPVDGLAARLVVQPRYVIGQPLTAVVEIKNVSDRTRYIVPNFDPADPQDLAVQITGPGGQPVRRNPTGHSFYHLGEEHFKALGPGEVRRFELPDLRRYFDDLQAWHCHPSRKANNVPTGKYVVQYRFHSPPVPAVPGKAPSPELTAGQWAHDIESAPVPFELRAPDRDDLVVHEWGVFTLFHDVASASANRKAEWGALPSFFYRQFPQERLRWVPAAWDKPVVYVYARPESVHLSVRVTFAAGVPVVWWPAVVDPVNSGTSPYGPDKGKPRPFRALTWDVWAGRRAPARSTNTWEDWLPQARAQEPWVRAEEFPLPADCWLNQARLPRATPLTVMGNRESAREGRRSPGVLDRLETERFLYYDGLVPAPDLLHGERLDDRGLVLRNRADFDIRCLFVVDRRTPGVVRFAARTADQEPLKAGSTWRVEPRPVAAGEWPAAGAKQVRQALVDAGLFGAEADALLRVWQKGLLEADGVTAFYLLPAAEYDRMLPLDVLPAPATRPVRVGIALHPRLELEPELAARVAALIRQLDSDRFEERDAADRALREMGPVAVGLLRAELAKGPPPEVRRRLQQVLEHADLGGWLRMPER